MEARTVAEAHVLKAEKRTASGSRACRALRAEDRIPAVIYGGDVENRTITVARKDLNQVIARHDLMLNLEVDGEEQMVIVKEIQHGTYDHEILHADFRAVSEKDIVHVEVPVELVGEPAGAQEGGVTEQELYAIPVACKPLDIPEKYEVDISPLQIGDSIHVSDLPAIPGVEIEQDPDSPVVMCSQPMEVEETVAEEEGVGLGLEEGVEPEVIGEAPEEEEGAEEAPEAEKEAE
jgi:large subunit ribosomal protein L25